MSNWNPQWGPEPKIVTLASHGDAFNFYIGQRVQWPPVTRWSRLVAWVKRVILRRESHHLMVTGIDYEMGTIEMSAAPTDSDVRRAMKKRGWKVSW
jgi:hypothetical protein